MLISEILWPEDRVEHIRRHQILPDEFEEICFGKSLVLRARKQGRNPVYFVLGQITNDMEFIRWYGLSFMRLWTVGIKGDATALTANAFNYAMGLEIGDRFSHGVRRHSQTTGNTYQRRKRLLEGELFSLYSFSDRLCHETYARAMGNLDAVETPGIRILSMLKNTFRMKTQS